MTIRISNFKDNTNRRKCFFNERIRPWRNNGVFLTLYRFKVGHRRSLRRFVTLIVSIYRWNTINFIAALTLTSRYISFLRIKHSNLYIRLVSLFRRFTCFIRRFITTFRRCNRTNYFLTTNNRNIICILRFRFLLIRSWLNGFLFKRLRLMTYFCRLRVFSTFVPFVWGSARDCSRGRCTTRGPRVTFRWLCLMNLFLRFDNVFLILMSFVKGFLLSITWLITALRFLTRIMPLIRVLVDLNVIACDYVCRKQVFMVITGRFTNSSIINVLMNFVRNFRNFKMLLIVMVLFPRIIMIFTGEPLNVRVLISNSNFLSREGFLFHVSPMRARIIRINYGLFRISLNAISNRHALRRALNGNGFARRIIRCSAFIVTSNRENKVTSKFRSKNYFIIRFGNFIMVTWFTMCAPRRKTRLYRLFFINKVSVFLNIVGVLSAWIRIPRRLFNLAMRGRDLYTSLAKLVFKGRNEDLDYVMKDLFKIIMRMFLYLIGRFLYLLRILDLR